jgi:Leucine-rich repeat (LRR) protein
VHLRGRKIPPKELKQKPKEPERAPDVKAVLERLEKEFGCFNPQEKSVGLGDDLDETQLQKALDEVAKLPNLEDLKLTGEAVSDATVRRVSKLVTLKTLGFDETSVTGASLGELAKLPRLEFLSIMDSPLDDDAMSRLASVTSLRKVMLNYSEISNSGVRHLCSLPALEGLYLKRTKVTDAVFQHVNTCPCLKELDVEETDVSDEGIQQLAGLKTLRELCVRGTRVTKAGVAALRKHLPKLVLGPR